MTPVYQTKFKVGKDTPPQERGNCWQAAVASLFDLSIDDVPNFIEYEDSDIAYQEWLNGLGYDYTYMYNPYRLGCAGEDNFKLIDKLQTVNDSGFFIATVYSPKHFDINDLAINNGWKPVCHAVVIDRNFNVVHDPNPENKGIIYPLAQVVGYNGVIGIDFITKRA